MIQPEQPIVLKESPFGLALTQQLLDIFVASRGTTVYSSILQDHFRVMPPNGRSIWLQDQAKTLCTTPLRFVPEPPDQTKSIGIDPGYPTELESINEKNEIVNTGFGFFYQELISNLVCISNANSPSHYQLSDYLYCSLDMAILGYFGLNKIKKFPGLKWMKRDEKTGKKTQEVDYMTQQSSFKLTDFIQTLPDNEQRQKAISVANLVIELLTIETKIDDPDDSTYPTVEDTAILEQIFMKDDYQNLGIDDLRAAVLASALIMISLLNIQKRQKTSPKDEFVFINDEAQDIVRARARHLVLPLLEYFEMPDLFNMLQDVYNEVYVAEETKVVAMLADWYPPNWIRTKSKDPIKRLASARKSADLYMQQTMQDMQNILANMGYQVRSSHYRNKSIASTARKMYESSTLRRLDTHQRSVNLFRIISSAYKDPDRRILLSIELHGRHVLVEDLKKKSKAHYVSVASGKKPRQIAIKSRSRQLIVPLRNPYLKVTKKIDTTNLDIKDTIATMLIDEQIADVIAMEAYDLGIDETKQIIGDGIQRQDITDEGIARIDRFIKELYCSSKGRFCVVDVNLDYLHNRRRGNPLMPLIGNFKIYDTHKKVFFEYRVYKEKDRAYISTSHRAYKLRSLERRRQDNKLSTFATYIILLNHKITPQKAKKIVASLKGKTNGDQTVDIEELLVVLNPNEQEP